MIVEEHTTLLSINVNNNNNIMFLFINAIGNYYNEKKYSCLK
jgi:hypothetical protein